MTKKTIINHVYSMINKQKLCSRLYRDEDWSNVRNFFSAIEKLGYKVSWWVENGGYRHDGHCKDYQCEIALGDIVARGYVSAAAAGTMADPWSAYDLTLILW